MSYFFFIISKPNSLSCFSEISEGAFIMRSRPSPVLGKAMTSRILGSFWRSIDDAVDARGEAAVRRRAISEGLKHMAEFFLLFFFGNIEEFEDLFLFRSGHEF